MKLILKSLLQGILLTIALVLGGSVIFMLVDLCLEKGIEYLFGGMILLIFVGSTLAFYFDSKGE